MLSFERILIVLLIAVALIALHRALIYLKQRRLQRLAKTPMIEELAPLVQPGRPAVLAFSTPGCIECQTRQRPALDTVASSMADQLDVVYLSVPEHPELVRHFGILSVPATVVLDPNGVAQHINMRYVSADQLEAQLADIVDQRQAA